MKSKLLASVIPVIALNCFDGWAVHGFERVFASFIIASMIFWMQVEYEEEQEIKKRKKRERRGGVKVDA